MNKCQTQKRSTYKGFHFRKVSQPIKMDPLTTNSLRQNQRYFWTILDRTSQFPFKVMLSSENNLGE